MKLGTRIKKLRKKIGMSQVELANKTNLSVKTIRRYELNQSVPTLLSLQKLAKGLNVAIVDLTDEKENQISFKNWLKSYKYIPGSYISKFYDDQKQSENDEEIISTIKEIQNLKHLPNKKKIDIETLKYLSKLDWVKEYFEDLKDDGFEVGLSLFEEDDYFYPFQFLFEEYDKYLKKETNENYTDLDGVKVSKMLDFAKTMPVLKHNDINDSEVLDWLAQQREALNYLFMRLRNAKVIKYDQGEWRGNDYKEDLKKEVFNDLERNEDK